jgi:hypothetical protein
MLMVVLCCVSCRRCDGPRWFVSKQHVVFTWRQCCASLPLLADAIAAVEGS